MRAVIADNWRWLRRWRELPDVAGDLIERAPDFDDVWFFTLDVWERGGWWRLAAIALIPVQLMVWALGVVLWCAWGVACYALMIAVPVLAVLAISVVLWVFSGFDSDFWSGDPGSESGTRQEPPRPPQPDDCRTAPEADLACRGAPPKGS